MARKRMIDPNFWASQDISKLSFFSRLVFIGIISNADDAGRGIAKAIFLKSTLFPYDEKLKISDIEKALNEIALNTSTVFYLHNGNEYYQFLNWNKWQKVEKPTPSKIEPFSDKCATIRGTVGEQSGSSRGVVAPNRIEDNIKEININTSPTNDSYSNKEQSLKEKEREGFYTTQVLKICEEECLIVYNRHLEKPNGDYELAKILKELMPIYPLQEIEELFKKANKTYIAQPKYDKCDLVWCLNNISEIKKAKEISENKKPQELPDYAN